MSPSEPRGKRAMQRRTFDVLASLGGLVLAIVLIGAAFIFHANADFAKSNVRTQLMAQKVFFPPAKALSAAERLQPGLVKYAGRQVVDGDMAEVFANQYIALHLRENLNGKTYSELSAASRAAPNDEKLAGQVQTAFRGETLRGILLTSYAFWTLGAKADQMVMVLLPGAGVMLLLSMLGFWHYSRTPKRKQLTFGSHRNGNGAAAPASAKPREVPT